MVPCYNWVSLKVFNKTFMSFQFHVWFGPSFSKVWMWVKVNGKNTSWLRWNKRITIAWSFMQHGVVTRWNLEFMQISLTPITSYNSAITRFNVLLEGIHFVQNNKAVQFQVRKKYDLLKKSFQLIKRFAITKQKTHKTHVLRIHYWAKSYKVIQPDIPESCVATCIHKFLVTNIYIYIYITCF